MLTKICVLFILQGCYGSYNVARNKAAMSTSVLDGHFDWNAAKVVDGNVNQNVYCGSCLHTQVNQDRRIEYVRIDLGEVYTINKIQAYFVRRSTPPCTKDSSSDIDIDAQQRSVKYTLLISSYEDIAASGLFCYKDGTVDATQFNLTQTQACNGTGRYLSLIQTNAAKGQDGPIIELCELEAYGCLLGMYGENCGLSCSQFCIDSICDPDTGYCMKGCREGWSGNNCTKTKNLAYMKNAVASSHLSLYPEWDAAKAVDGNENDNLYCGSCLHTGNTPGVPAYLTVDMGEKTTFNRVEIYFVKYDQYSCTVNDKISTNVPLRSKGYSIQIGTVSEGEECFHDTSDDFSFTENVSCLGTGQLISVIQMNPSSGIIGPILEICELKVFGCKIGYFGQDCENECPENCNNGICDPDTGFCWYGCSPGWTGIRCLDVSDNYTGDAYKEKNHCTEFKVSTGVLGLACFACLIVIVCMCIHIRKIKKTEYTTMKDITKPLRGSLQKGRMKKDYSDINIESPEEIGRKDVQAAKVQ